jgi:hypothetical protein
MTDLKSSGSPWWHPQRIPHFSPLWADDDDDDDDDELWRPDRFSIQSEL